MRSFLLENVNFVFEDLQGKFLMTGHSITEHTTCKCKLHQLIISGGVPRSNSNLKIERQITNGPARGRFPASRRIKKYKRTRTCVSLVFFAFVYEFQSRISYCVDYIGFYKGLLKYTLKIQLFF